MEINDFKIPYNIFNEYTELRLQRNTNLRVVSVNGNIEKNEVSKKKGVFARVYKNGSWGTSSSFKIDEKTIKKVIESAKENALFLDKKENKNIEKLPSNPWKFSSPKKEISNQKDLIDFAKELESYINKKYEKLLSRKIIISSFQTEKNLLTSEKSELSSTILINHLILGLSINRNGGVISLHDNIHFDSNLDKLEDFYLFIDRLYDRLMQKTEGIYPQLGIQDVILDHRVSSILIHESIGHLVEADNIMKGSIARNYINEQIANPIVNITDFANTALNNPCPVPVYIDDEGCKAEDVNIIEDGILKNLLHNKETALFYNSIPKGNARNFDYYDIPIIRMRNTTILPGKDKLEEMIKSVDNGYYLITPSNGESDLTSDFIFGVAFGYEIKNGKLGKALKNMTISGNAINTLKTITMISDNIKWNCYGYCSKMMQLQIIGNGGAAIKCKVNIGANNN